MTRRRKDQRATLGNCTRAGGASSGRRAPGISRATKAAGYRFSRRELAVIRRHRTPTQVQQLLNSFDYNWDEPYTIMSFRSTLRARRAHCLEAAILAAVILEVHGYPPLILDLISTGDPDHVVYAYRNKRTGLWGAVGKSSEPGLEGRKAVFTSVRALAYSYFDPFIDGTARLKAYGLGNLQALGNVDWRLSERPVWAMDGFFTRIHHTALPPSERRYRRWHRKYMDFKRDNPDGHPIYFPGRRSWAPGFRRK